MEFKRYYEGSYYISAERREGFDAHCKDVKMIRNPYERESKQYNEWKEGWMTAWWKAGEGDWR